MAAGLSLLEENLEELRRRLNENTTLTEEDLRPVVRIDVAMPIEYITEEFVEQLELLEPFGKGNPKPIFAEQHFRFTGGNIIGKNKNVMKAKVVNGSGARIEALYFGQIDQLQEYVIEEFGQQEWERMLRGDRNDVDLGLTYYPDINEYMGRKTPQIVIQNYCRIQ